MEWGDSITHLVDLIPDFLREVKMVDPMLKGLNSSLVNKIIVSFLQHGVRNPPPALVEAINSLRKPIEVASEALARGWDHLTFPFEVAFIPGSPRWSEVEENSKREKALEAHRKECGCPWPETDYVHPVKTWINFIFIGKLYDVGVVEILDKLCDRAGFVNNLEATLRVARIVMEQHPHEPSEAINRIEELLVEDIELKRRGKLNHYSFSDPVSWSFCEKCGSGIPPEVMNRRTCSKCLKRTEVVA